MRKTSLALRKGLARGGEKEPVSGSVTLGNGKAVNIPDIPLITLFRCIEKEIKARVSNEQERQALLGRLKEIAQDPAFAPILSTPVGEVLKRLF